MNALMESLKALGGPRLTAMAVVAAAVLGLLTLLALRGGGAERMALLYGDLDLKEAAQMADALDRAHIAHQPAAGGAALLVPAEQVAQARLLLARDGLPSGGSIGYELLDRGDGLMMSAAQQAINQARALEGELSRTIRAMRGVQAARVHLVLPTRQPFTRDRQDPQASVLLTLNAAARLDRDGIEAIQNLVAAAVPGLRPRAVSLVDSRGGVLAAPVDPNDRSVVAAGADAQRREAELRLGRAVETMLGQSLGPGHVHATASLELDYDQVHETEERYDPDGKVERSTQSTSDSGKTTEQANTVTVQNNLPNADAGGTAGGSQTQHSEETTNFEIGRTVRTLVREQPRIRRISLAVMVDGTLDKDGVWKERSPEELARLGRLVQSAVGFDQQRGDHVEVVSMRFAAEEPGLPAANGGLFGLPLDKADLIRLGQTAMLGLTVLLAMLFVLRPMVLRLAPAGGGGLLAAGEAAGLISPDGSMRPRLLGGAAAGPAEAEMDESMVNVAQIEGQLRASSIRQIADLVDRHPEESANIVRGWLQQEDPG